MGLSTKYSKQEAATFGFGLMISNLISQSLSNVKRINGGGIQLISKHHVGTTFYFLINDFTKLVNENDLYSD